MTVRISDEETTCKLRAYISHRKKWSDVIEDIKEHSNHFNEQTKELYARSTVRQLRNRLSAKLSTLMAKLPETITNIEIRNLVRPVRAVETRHVEGHGEANRQQQPDANVDPPQQPDRTNLPQPNAVGAAADVRDQAAADLSSPSSDDDAAAPQVRARRRRKPLSELIRENQTFYNRFMKTKMLKILREIGISSSDESD